ncbi:MAG: hypothetical protein IPL83_02485 [Bdellovibrionales bacterium]|nr:hypothetical protein [Bdellovibrionales bacterium]
MNIHFATSIIFFVGCFSFANDKSSPKPEQFQKTIGYYGINLGLEKSQLHATLEKLGIHHLGQEEHLKVLNQGKLASVIFQYKDICADDPKDLGKGYELVICTFTSEKAKAQKTKGMALVFAGSKLFRIEVNLTEKTTKELDQLMKEATAREKEKLNAIGKSNLLFSFFHSSTHRRPTQLRNAFFKRVSRYSRS